MKTYSFEELRERYEKKTPTVITAECTFTTELVGGLPAPDDRLAMFAEHQLRLQGEEINKAVARMKAEEIEPTEIPAGEGELKESLSLGMNVIRRDEHGPWLGDWMIKACLKCAASRLHLFEQKKGTKGAMAELGEAQAFGISLIGDNKRRIYLRDPTGKEPAATDYEYFRGSVGTPQGRKSIMNRAEYAPVGTRFAFQFRTEDGKFTEDDWANIYAIAMIIGLGSCKSFERGKFSIEKLTLVGARSPVGPVSVR